MGDQQLESETLFDLVKTGTEKSLIKLSGSNKTVEVPGSVLEAQLELQNGWALILTTEGNQGVRVLERKKGTDLFLAQKGEKSNQDTHVKCR